MITPKVPDRKVHATVTGILNFSSYNEAHMTLQQAD